MNQVFLAATIFAIATLSLVGFVASSIALAQNMSGGTPEKAKLPAEQNMTGNATNTTITEGVSPNATGGAWVLKEPQRKEMDNPPLWVWAIVVGLIIAGKFAYRWKTTKQLAKEMEQRGPNKAMTDSKNNNTERISNIRTTMSHKYSRHKYSPSSFRSYFETRKTKGKAP